jgi:ubiquinone/menaquinone biosynthesis C-methylase UbiE
MPTTPDFAAIKHLQQAAWTAGNYSVIGNTLIIASEQLCEAVDLRSGSRVLDVAAGSGNTSLAAARRWARVTSTDYVLSLLEDGRRRAEADGLDHAITFEFADAENLTFPTAAFDVVLSTFGVMFAPNQERAAAELTRVCRPGGTIGLTAWTPTSFVGLIFRTIGKYLPPPDGVRPPSLWGTEDHLHELFPTVAALRATRRNAIFRYLSPDHWLEMFRTFYGPMNKAYAALETDPEKQLALTADLHALMAELNTATDGTLVLPSEYLEIVITR